jgi:hypothetical protein
VKKERYFSTFQLILLALFAALIVVAKIALRTPVQLSGDLGALNTFLSYAAVGLGTDLALLLLRNPENLLVATLSATIGHLCKFLVKWGLGIVTGAPLGFVALGLAKAFVGYIVFGALGGLLGGLTLKALRKAGFFAYLAEKR